MALNFRDSQKIGKLGEVVVVDFVKRIHPRWVVTPIVTKERQKKFGDYEIDAIKRVIYIEIKTEETDKWGNFFLEEWSNDETPGWLRYCEADLVFYLFLNDKKLYAMNLKKLKRWAYTDENITRYTLKSQRKYTQMNNTKGYCMPIEHCRKLGKEIDFFEVIL
jgi:hypothetical protein